MVSEKLDSPVHTYSKHTLSETIKPKSHKKPTLEADFRTPGFC